MSLRFENALPRNIVCVRVGGPWQETVPVGFRQIIVWAQGQGIAHKEALVFYWDDPAQTDVADLRADVALTVDAQITPDTAGTEFREETVPGGLYAVWHTLVRDGAYAKAWNDLYAAIENSEYELARGVCFENYLCDGRDGKWDIEIWQSVERKPSHL